MALVYEDYSWVATCPQCGHTRTFYGIDPTEETYIEIRLKEYGWVDVRAYAEGITVEEFCCSTGCGIALLCHKLHGGT